MKTLRYHKMSTRMAKIKKTGRRSHSGTIDQWHLGSAGTQVQSLAWHSGFQDPALPQRGLGHNCGLDLIPGLGTPFATGQPQKKKKKTGNT